MSDLISIVIPIYNVDQYLERCLDSILNQDYVHFEAILVNDGSTDNSAGICERYALQDKRFKYIYQKNGGLSVARNTGIKASSGKYLCFIDSDDYVDQTYLASLYDAIQSNDADLAWCDYWIKGKSYQHAVIQNEQGFRYFVHPCAWNKIYKKSLFIENNILFPVGLWYEDLATTPRILLHCEKVIHVEKPLYYYCQNSNSIIRTYSARIMEIEKVFKVLENYSNETGLDYDEEAIQFVYLNHGLCATVFRMMRAGMQVEAIRNFYDKMIAKIGKKRYWKNYMKQMPIYVKGFNLLLHYWTIPLLQFFLKKRSSS